MPRIQRTLPSKLLLFTLVMTLMTGCGIFKKDKSDKGRDVGGIENFDRFYDKFHSDPEFQLSRINFPIEGKMIDGHTEQTWNRNNWMIMKVKIYDIDQGDFKTTYDKKADSFYQKFWAEDAGFFAEYRFEVIDGKWYLVYAKDVNL